MILPPSYGQIEKIFKTIVFIKNTTETEEEWFNTIYENALIGIRAVKEYRKEGKKRIDYAFEENWEENARSEVRMKIHYSEIIRIYKSFYRTK